MCVGQIVDAFDVVEAFPEEAPRVFDREGGLEHLVHVVHQDDGKKMPSGAPEQRGTLVFEALLLNSYWAGPVADAMPP